MAFSLKNLFSKKPTAAVAARDNMPATVTAQGAVIGARPHQNPAWSRDYTPERVANILEAAERGDEFALGEYFALVDKVIEREMHTAGVVNGLVLAVAGLPHKVMPPKATSATKRAQKIADDVQSLFEPSSPLRLAAPGIISQGITHGIGAAAVLCETTPTSWKPVQFMQKPAHFFTFDRTDGRTPLLRNELAGQAPLPIEPGTALVFTPSRNAALQIKNGLGWILAWAYVIKSIVIGNKLTRLENFGNPVVVGTYPRNTTPEDISLLHRAVAAVNNSFRTVYREDLNIDFKEAPNGHTDMYEKVCRYFDELISKVVWASTLTTDSNSHGTYALGKIHAEGKYDVIRTYAHQWSAALQHLVNAYVVWNYGPDAPIPTILVDVEEPEDLVAKSTIIKNLRDAGVPLVASEIRQAFGFREPQEGDELIGAAVPISTGDGSSGNGPASTQEPAGAAQNNRQGVGCPVHSSNAVAPARDALDELADEMLADWQAINTAIDEKLAAAANNTASIEDMRAALVALAEELDTEDLAVLLTKARTKARLAGDTGTKV